MPLYEAYEDVFDPTEINSELIPLYANLTGHIAKCETVVTIKKKGLIRKTTLTVVCLKSKGIKQHIQCIAWDRHSKLLEANARIGRMVSLCGILESTGQVRITEFTLFPV